MAVTVASPREQIADAVRLCRQCRHHQDCRCYSFRNQHGEAFCTSFESSWATIVDRLIDRARLSTAQEDT